MWKAALKSLLGRKLRLLMSTFAIVLGVAFVAGSLIFSDTLDRSFTAIFASSVGDVVVRPVGGQAEDGGPTARTVPARTAEQLTSVPGAARVDGNVSAIGVYVIGTDDKAVGGFGPPALGGNWTDAPAGHGLEGLTITEGHERTGPDEVVLDDRTAERGGYSVGDEVHIVTAGTQEVLHPTLVGLADFADGGSLNGATLSAFDTQTAQDLFLQGKDAYTDVWVTADDGVSQEELRDAVAQRLPDGFEAITGDDLAEEQADSLLQALSFIRTFLLIFAGISLVVGGFLIVNTFSILVAQRSRELALLRALGASKRQVTRSVLLRGVRARRDRLDHRPRPRCRARPGHPRPVLPVRSRPDGFAGLRAAHRGRGVRRRHPGHHGGRVACRPGTPRGSRRSRRCATTSRCRRRPCTAGWWPASC